MCVGRCVNENTELSAQFFYKLETALKNKIYYIYFKNLQCPNLVVFERERDKGVSLAIITTNNSDLSH